VDVKRAKVRLQDDDLSMGEIADGLLASDASPLEIYGLVAHALRGAIEVHEESFEEMTDRALDLCAGQDESTSSLEGLFSQPEDMTQLKQRAQEHANLLMRMSKEQRGTDGQDVPFREAYAFRALQGLFLYLEKNWETEERARAVLVKILDAASVALGSEESVRVSIVSALGR